MPTFALPAATVPLVAALVPGLAAGGVLLFRRVASARLSERSLRRRHGAGMTIRAVVHPATEPETQDATAAAQYTYPDVGRGLIVGPERPLPAARAKGAA